MPMLRDGEQMVDIIIHVPLLKTNFSTSAAAKYSQNFETFAQMEVAVYMRETLYRHCKFSANFRFRKMFYPPNFVVELIASLIIFKFNCQD
jgi:hypothetical protein